MKKLVYIKDGKDVLEEIKKRKKNKELERDLFQFRCFSVDKKPQTEKSLCWRVFTFDPNIKKFQATNLFDLNTKVNARIYEITKKIKDPIEFEKEINSVLHEFWSRSEYEIGVCENFPMVSKQQLELIQEDFKKDEDLSFANAYINYEKIDVYTQITMNWEPFIKYLWNNKDLIYQDLEEYYKPEKEKEKRDKQVLEVVQKLLKRMEQ